MSVKVNEWASNGTTFEYGSAANPVSGPLILCNCWLPSQLHSTLFSATWATLFLPGLQIILAVIYLAFGAESTSYSHWCLSWCCPLCWTIHGHPSGPQPWLWCLPLLMLCAHHTVCNSSMQLAGAYKHMDAGEAACTACRTGWCPPCTVPELCRNMYGCLTLILWAELPYPATSPNLLGNYVRIVNGERIETVANATSNMFYCIRYASCRAPYHMYSVASSASAGLLHALLRCC